MHEPYPPGGSRDEALLRGNAHALEVDAAAAPGNAPECLRVHTELVV